MKQSINIPRIIAELSLDPSDIIATRPPSGIGAGHEPPEYLEPGEVMETEIATLRNVITLVRGGAA